MGLPSSAYCQFIAATTMDSKGHTEAFATGRKSRTIVNGVGSIENTIVGVASTRHAGVGSGIHRGLVGGGGLVLLG